jgi:hypothetical protein
MVVTDADIVVFFIVLGILILAMNTTTPKKK